MVNYNFWNSTRNPAKDFMKLFYSNWDVWMYTRRGCAAWQAVRWIVENIAPDLEEPAQTESFN